MDLFASLSAADRAAVLAHRTLEAVVRWGYARSPVVEVLDVIPQDEFTHDVLVPLSEELVLVYDST